MDLSQPVKRLARLHQLGEQKIRELKRAAGFPAHPRQRPLIPCPAGADLSGKLKEVGARYGVCPQVARRWKLEAGMACPPQGRPRKLMPVPPQ